MSEPYGEARAGQEAAKLLAAAQDWLRSSAPHVAPVDDEGRTCACPLCRALAGVREADPEAVGRWVDSAVAAATTLVAQASERLVAPVDPTDDRPSEWSATADATDDLDLEVLDDPDGDLEDVEDVEDLDGPVGGVGTGGPESARPDAGARQDEDRSRGVRRIPLDQQEPGDLDG